MAKKKARNKTKRPIHQKYLQSGQHRFEGLGVPTEQAKHFMVLYNAKELENAQRLATVLVEQYPESAFAWKALGTSYLEAGDPQTALEPLLTSIKLDKYDPVTLTSLAGAYYRLGEYEKAVNFQRRAVSQQPSYAQAHFRFAEMLQSAGKAYEGVKHARKAEALGFDRRRSLLLLALLEYDAKSFSRALAIYRQMEEEFPDEPSVMNNLGNLYKDIGQYAKAERCYQRALDLNPDMVLAYSNIFFAKHYNPAETQTNILAFAKRWDEHFAQSRMSSPENSRNKSKPLRVGLISSGFRLHPVGQMIASVLASSRPDINFYGYSTNNHIDHITEKVRASCRVWRSVRHLSQQKLAHQVRDDGIDIVIDLSGHSEGSCLQALSMRPAPLCIKWVGGLLNTVGVEGIDYLLSDHIETPIDIDDKYTEKLIRLPDDYICYMPPFYAPSINSLPALNKGYITLGCLNNPAKISNELLAEWAKLMHQLPESRLLLRGAQYESVDFCEWLWEEMAQQGIEKHRVLLEGPTNHKDFIGTYQRIDIALDTWPYSGGLTTCEALLMGVPVVTLPGPTFAGRHSATHLINAGLQELVTSSWDEYRQRVLELANDLPNLAVIRAGLRTILNYSPVCDAPRFANHFNNALRAIWVRYCEGKSPEALTFNKEGELWFEDDKLPLELPEARSEEEPENEEFEWQLDEPITIIDNAAVLPRHPDYPKWMASGHLAVISFDPASLLNKKVEALQEYGELHHYPHALLGDGQPATLHAALDAEKGSTLKPLPEEEQPECLREKTKTLTELAISTIRLDDIEGIPDVDMLVLDDLHDVMKMLENGQQTLKNTLLIQVKVAFQPTHEYQPNLAELQHWSARNGFRLYRLNTPQHLSHLPDSVPADKRQATELISADAIFVSDHERTASLTKKQRTKLAFLLHTVYGIKDMAYELLAAVDEEKAEGYLQKESLVSKLQGKYKYEEPKGVSVTEELEVPPPAGPPIPQSEHVKGEPVVSVICPAYNHANFIEDAIKGFIAQKTDFPFEIIIHDDASTDGTQEVIKYYAEQYPELIRPIYQTENQYSQNKKPLDICLPLTKGEYVAICDGDDYWTDPNKLKIQFSYMEENASCMITHHNAFVFKKNTLISGSKLPKHFIKNYTSDELLRNSCFILTLSMMFRKKFDKFPKEKGNIGNGDNFLISIMGLYGDSHFLKEIKPAAYRLHPDSTWSSKKENEKNKMLSNSLYWIGTYHDRKGRKDISAYYYKKSKSLG
ncbi:glycosyltransferase [Vreelandella aquamarina]